MAMVQALYKDKFFSKSIEKICCLKKIAAEVPSVPRDVVCKSVHNLMIQEQFLGKASFML